MRLYLNDLGILSAAGNNGDEILSRLQSGDRSGLIRTDEYSPGQPFYLGAVQAELPEIGEKYSVYDCRNNQLLLAASIQIKATVDSMIKKYGVDRIGVVIGTSTSGVRNTELALAEVARGRPKPQSFHYKQQQFAGGADFLGSCSGAERPCLCHIDSLLIQRQGVRLGAQVNCFGLLRCGYCRRCR